MAYGKFFSKTYTTVAGADLLTQFATDVGLSDVNLKKVTLIAGAELHVDLNATGVYSEMYLDTADSKYKLNIDDNEVFISKLITQEAGVSVWIAGIY